MDLIENLISNLIKKETPVSSETEQTSPNSWGVLEYNGMTYKFVKGKKANPKEETYNHFIADVVRQFDKITIRKDNLVPQPVRNS